MYNIDLTQIEVQLELWKTHRTATEFNIPCDNKEQALEIRDYFKDKGYHGFVQLFSTWEVSFKLGDNK